MLRGEKSLRGFSYWKIELLPLTRLDSNNLIQFRMEFNIGYLTLNQIR